MLPPLLIPLPKVIVRYPGGVELGEEESELGEEEPSEGKLDVEKLEQEELDVSTGEPNGIYSSQIAVIWYSFFYVFLIPRSVHRPDKSLARQRKNSTNSQQRL